MNEDPNIDPTPESTPRPQATKSWLIGAAIVFLCATIISLGYVAREADYARQLASHNDQLNAALNQTRTQVDMLAAKLSALNSAAPTATSTALHPAATPQKPAGTLHHPASRAKHAKRQPVEDPRWKQVQAQLADHEKQLQTTQQNLQRTREELEGNLSSTRDELNGSIAKTHDELVALEKKGERNYYEFDLPKSKVFRHVGPLSIALRKTDPKHLHYDAVVILDDYKLNRKHVNLYEPVQFYPEGGHQAIELVVNKIEKNRVVGYVSEPKYRGTESRAAAGTAQPGDASSAASPTTPAQPNPAASSGTQASLQRRQDSPH